MKNRHNIPQKKEPHSIILLLEQGGKGFQPLWKKEVGLVLVLNEEGTVEVDDLDAVVIDVLRDRDPCRWRN